MLILVIVSAQLPHYLDTPLLVKQNIESWCSRQIPVQFPWGSLMPYMILGKIQDGPFLRKKVFFHFWGPPLIFFGPQNLIRHQKPHFWGVIFLTFFDPSYGFRDFWGGCVDGAKTWNFQLLNHCSDQRILEVKWGFLGVTSKKKQSI